MRRWRESAVGPQSRCQEQMPRADAKSRYPEQMITVKHPHTPAESASRAADRRLVILGASARALAESAHRAGWAVHAADLFCDLDVLAISTKAVSVADDHGDDEEGYPWSLRAAAASFARTLARSASKRDATPLALLVWRGPRLDKR